MRYKQQQSKFSPPRIPDIIWAPLVAGVLILVVGLTGVAAHRPWLFASLASTAFLQVETPEHPSSRFYNAVMGHLIGLASAMLVVALLGAASAPSVLKTGELTTVRVWAAVLAVGLTMLGTLLAGAQHAPAASTTLLIAVGGFKPTLEDTLTVIGGVLIVASVGEVLRRLRLGQPAPVPASARGVEDVDELLSNGSRRN